MTIILQFLLDACKNCRSY